MLILDDPKFIDSRKVIKFIAKKQAQEDYWRAWIDGLKARWRYLAIALLLWIIASGIAIYIFIK